MFRSFTRWNYRGFMKYEVMEVYGKEWNILCIYWIPRQRMLSLTNLLPENIGNHFSLLLLFFSYFYCKKICFTSLNSSLVRTVKSNKALSNNRKRKTSFFTVSSLSMNFVFFFSLNGLTSMSSFLSQK